MDETKQSRPYQVERDGRKLFVASDIGENLLGAAYLRIVEEKMLDCMFWLKAPTLREFLEWATARPDVVVIGGFVDDGETIQLASIGWVREIKERCGRKYADTGELVFREFQAMGLSQDLVRLMLDFAFQEVGVAALYGYTPRPNIAAVRFMKSMGFGHTCEIPEAAAWMGEPCAAIVSWLTRRMWMEQTGRENTPVGSAA